MDALGAAAGAATDANQGEASEKRSDIYTHQFSNDLYAMGWSVRPDKPFRLAVGSFVDAGTDNTVEVVQLDDDLGSFASRHK